MPALNGGWPDLPAVPPPIERFPDNPTAGQAIKILGSTLIMFGQLWPRVVQALEYLRGWTEEHDRAHALPLMRQQSASSHDLAKALGGEVAEAYEADLRYPRTPDVPSPQSLAALIENRAQQLLEKRDAAKWRQVEHERNVAENTRIELEAINKKSRARALWTAVIGGISTTTAAIAWALEHFGQH
jgi:hypothetical protein